MARGPNPEVLLFWSILFTEIQPSSCLHNWLQLSQYNGRAKHLQEEKTVEPTEQMFTIWSFTEQTVNS